MAQYQFDGDDVGAAGTFESIANTSMGWLVRLAGLALLAVGLWTAVSIISEAWSIYTNPKNARVEAFARAIDEATHLDTLIAPPRPAPVAEATVKDGAAAAARPAPPSVEAFRLSYFVAWAILMMMLLLVGRLAIAAIKTGGELALYDVQIRRFARELLRQSARERNRS